MKTQPILMMPLSKAWSEEAREAAAEARRGGSSSKVDEKAYGGAADSAKLGVVDIKKEIGGSVEFEMYNKAGSDYYTLTSMNGDKAEEAKIETKMKTLAARIGKVREAGWRPVPKRFGNKAKTDRQYVIKLHANDFKK